MPTHTFATKTGAVALADLDVALGEAAKGLPYYPLDINNQTGSPYVLVLADANPNRLVRINRATDGQVTVPPNSSVAFPLGSLVVVDQWGNGQVHFVGGSGVEVRRADSAWSHRQYSRVFLQKVATDEWLLFGDLEPTFSSP